MRTSSVSCSDPREIVSAIRANRDDLLHTARVRLTVTLAMVEAAIRAIESGEAVDDHRALLRALPTRQTEPDCLTAARVLSDTIERAHTALDDDLMAGVYDAVSTLNAQAGGRLSRVAAAQNGWSL